MGDRKPKADVVALDNNKDDDKPTFAKMEAMIRHAQSDSEELGVYSGYVEQLDKFIGVLPKSDFVALGIRKVDDKPTFAKIEDMIRRVQSDAVELGVLPNDTGLQQLDEFIDVLRKYKSDALHMTPWNEHPPPPKSTHSSSARLGSFKLYWRIFPPPTDQPRRTKKKKQQKNHHKRQKCKHDECTRNSNESNDQQGQIPRPQKELWRQKQHQYHYTYPYKDSENVIVMIPQPLEVRPGQDIGKYYSYYHNKKRPKRNPDGFHQIDYNKNNWLWFWEAKDSSIQYPLVPVKGIVENIRDHPSGNMIDVLRMDLSNGSDLLCHRVLFKERQKRLSPTLAEDPMWMLPSVILVEETLPFRQVVKFQLHNHRIMKDRVLEIGCSTGELSKIVWKNHLAWERNLAGPQQYPTWIGMDHSQEMIDRCQKQLNQFKESNPSARLYEAKVVKVDVLEEPKKAWEEATTPSEQFGPCPTVVLIDIGGNRECGPVVKILAWVLETFGGNNDFRMVIVKSRALVRQLQSDSKIKSETNGTTTNTNAIKIKSETTETTSTNAIKFKSERFKSETNEIVSTNSIKIKSEINETTNTNAIKIKSETSNVTNDIPSLDATDGRVSGGTEWFVATHKKILRERKNRFEQRFKHPLKAPKVLSPVDGTTPICRYHNYHKDGCKLYNDQGTFGTVCPLDHDHCHFCLEKGHLARNCPNHQIEACY